MCGVCSGHDIIFKHERALLHFKWFPSKGTLVLLHLSLLREDPSQPDHPLMPSGTENVSGDRVWGAEKAVTGPSAVHPQVSSLCAICLRLTEQAALSQQHL